MTVATITPRELAELCARGDVNLIDVRTPAEFREIHIPAARNIPLSDLRPDACSPGVGGPVYLVCRSGGRGRQACEKLLAAGRADVVNVDGGTLAWEHSGLPVVRGKKSISLERQVRIAAGSLVLLGCGLGWRVHAGFFAVPAFIGAGLVFAGVTDTCGMGMLLARAPWNRARTCATNGAVKMDDNRSNAS